jgi:hypothetical protein
VGSVETREARAGSVAEVADTSSRAVAAGLVAVAVQGISARGALLQLAGGSAVTSIAKATNVFHGIPRGVVGAAGLVREVLLGPAGAAVVAVIGAGRALACNAVIAGEARTLAGLTVARSLVRALHPRVQVVGVDHITNPGEVARAGAQRAVGAGPLRLAVQAGEAFAVVVHLTRAVVGAVVLAQAAVSVAALVPGDLAPRFRSESGGAGGRRSSTSGAITCGIGSRWSIGVRSAGDFRCATSAVIVSGAHCAFIGVVIAVCTSRDTICSGGTCLSDVVAITDRGRTRGGIRHRGTACYGHTITSAI